MLGERLKTAREYLGKSQKEMAKAIGVSITGWQNYESGSHCPGGKIFESLVKLGFNANWLLTGNGPMMREGLEDKAAGDRAKVANLVKEQHQEFFDKHVRSRMVFSTPVENDEEDEADYGRDIRQRRSLRDRRLLEDMTRLLCMVVETYENHRPSTPIAQKAREISLIYRYFIDNYDKSNDEVDILQYIEEWF